MAAFTLVLEEEDLDRAGWELISPPRGTSWGRSPPGTQRQQPGSLTHVWPGTLAVDLDLGCGCQLDHRLVARGCGSLASSQSGGCSQAESKCGQFLKSQAWVCAGTTHHVCLRLFMEMLQMLLVNSLNTWPRQAAN